MYRREGDPVRGGHCTACVRGEGDFEPVPETRDRGLAAINAVEKAVGILIERNGGTLPLRIGKAGQRLERGRASGSNKQKDRSRRHDCSEIGFLKDTNVHVQFGCVFIYFWALQRYGFRSCFANTLLTDGDTF